ncbi:MAG: hypothetical protein A2235_08465 [Deltaproteobacteria bacterium RIFOXYA2_FULL_42_10]|nr:MAG: hypothetical protein A2235_08465 [Deltaproteobacteria bacterium RIFOXYA2_FULL_42_10]
MRESEIQNVKASKQYGVGRRQKKKRGRRSVFLLLLTAYCLLHTVVTGCGKSEKEAITEETQVAVVEKSAEVAPTVETIPTEFAEAYKKVFVVSEVDGVDWQKGVITAVGRGYPPKDITNPAQVRILTMRAAKLEGYKALLETIMKIKTPPDKGMKQYLDERHIEISRVEGFVKGARIIKEEYKDDGSAEVTLEVPLTGVSGLVAVMK